VAFTLPAAVHARFMYARKLFAHLNNGSASTAKFFEMACEEFIQGHEQEVPENLRGDVPPVPSDEATQTALPLEDGDTALPIADGELVDDGEGGDLVDEPFDLGDEVDAAPAADLEIPTDDEPDAPQAPVVPEYVAPKLHAVPDLPEDEGEPQPVDNLVAERVAELDQLVNAELVDLAHGHGLTATARMPKRLLVRMIVNAEFPTAEGLVQ
jgi:hypothetical protein